MQQTTNQTITSNEKMLLKREMLYLKQETNTLL